MAILLAERGVNAVAATLLAQLATELTAIDTARGDGITMAAPGASNYYKRPKPVIEGATVHVEVFETGFTFNWAWSDMNDSRATYEMPVTVRLTYFNRTGADRDEMVTRMRRYAAGIFNTITKNYRLGGTTDYVLGCRVDSISPPWESLDDSAPGTFKGSVTVQLTVRCEEIQ